MHGSSAILARLFEPERDEAEEALAAARNVYYAIQARLPAKAPS